MYHNNNNNYYYYMTVGTITTQYTHTQGPEQFGKQKRFFQEWLCVMLILCLLNNTGNSKR